ncbi:MAG: apolipoprotein N-acyltransferase [Candidatus Binatia bacterium]
MGTTPRTVLGERPKFRAFVLSVASGLLYALSFLPLPMGWLCWVALVPLLVAAMSDRPAAAFRHGLVAGLVGALGVGWPLPSMLVAFFGLSPTLAAVAFAVASVGGFAIYVAVIAAWASWLAGRRMANPVIIGCGWCVSEFCRANLGIANPWALSAYSQVSFAHVTQIADVAGPYGIGFLLGAMNAALAAFFVRDTSARPISWLVVVVGLVGVACAYGHWRLGQVFVFGEPIRIALMQGSSPAQHPITRPEQDAAFTRYVAMTHATISDAPDLVLWPENAIGFYVQEDSPRQRTLLEVSRDIPADLVLGGSSYVQGLTTVSYYNSAFLLRAGDLVDRYDKTRLMPIAEGDELRWLRGPRSADYERGTTVHPLPTRKAQLGVLLCSELMFPDLARRHALGGAEVLANLSNDSWFGYVVPSRFQLALASLRAIETRRYLVRATIGGFSAIIDPTGRIEVVSRFDAGEVVTGTVRRSQTLTPYQRLGDASALFAAALVIVGSAYALLERG